MTTKEIREFCDFLDTRYSDDTNHLTIIIGRGALIEDLEGVTVNHGLQNVDEFIDKVIDELETVDILYDYNTEISEILYEMLDTENDEEED